MWLQFLKTRLKLEHRKLQRQMISRSLSALSCEVLIKITSQRVAKFKIDFKKTSIGHGDRFLQLIFSCLKVNRVCLVMPENAKITLVLQGSIGPSACWLNFYQSLECGRRTFKTRLEIKVVAGHSHQTRNMKIVVAITLLRLSVYCGYCCFSDSYCDHQLWYHSCSAPYSMCKKTWCLSYKHLLILPWNLLTIHSLLDFDASFVILSVHLSNMKMKSTTCLHLKSPIS